MTPSKLKMADLLLIMLYSDGVKTDLNEAIMGRTRLIKMLFVFNKEYFKDFTKERLLIDESSLPEFFPWKFGPMSKDILEDLEFFIKIKFIKATENTVSFAYEEAREFSSIANDISLQESSEQEYTEEAYTLTDIGLKYVESRVWGLLNESQKHLIKELKNRFNKASLRQILKYVYEKYEDYTENSIIKEDILNK